MDAFVASYADPATAETPWNQSSWWLVSFAVSRESGLKAENRSPCMIPPGAFKASECRRAPGQFPPVLVDFGRFREPELSRRVGGSRCRRCRRIDRWVSRSVGGPGRLVGT